MKLFSVGYIYLITNLVNGKKYIGQTTNRPELRWRSHTGSARGKGDSALCRAMRKYGIVNFSFEVIYTCTIPLLDAAEKYYIAEYDSFGKGGYNCTSGSQFTHKRLSRAARKKISDKKYALYTDVAEREKHSKICKVAHNTPEAKLNHALATKKSTAKPEVHARRCAASKRRFEEHPVSDTTRRKQSKVQRKRFDTIGVSEETRRKQSETHLRRYENIDERARTGAATRAYYENNPTARLQKSAMAKSVWQRKGYRAAMSKKFKARPPMTEETRQRRSEAQLKRHAAKPTTAATKAKISATRLARYGKVVIT